MDAIREIVPIICRLTPLSLKDIAEIDGAASDTPWSFSSLANEVKQEGSIVFGARCRGELVGFVLYRKAVDEVHMLKVAVRWEWQGMGIGGALLAESFLELHEDQVATVRLEVRVSNRAAISLYRRLGFDETGKLPRYYTNNGEDAVLMELDLYRFCHQFRQEHRS